MVGDAQQILFVNQICDQVGAGEQPANKLVMLYDGAAYAITHPRVGRGRGERYLVNGLVNVVVAGLAGGTQAAKVCGV